MSTFHYFRRRYGWFRWEVVYTVKGDSLARPVYGIPKFWTWVSAEGCVLALVWAREMGAYCVTNDIKNLSECAP